MDRTKNRIQERREELGMTISDLNRITNIVTPTLYSFEREKPSDFNSLMLIKLSNALKISPDYLAGVSDEKVVLTSPIFPTNIHNNIIKKIRNEGYLKGQSGQEDMTVVEFDKKHPDLPVLYSIRWTDKARISLLSKFTKFFNCSLQELISINLKQKTSELENEEKNVEDLKNYFKEPISEIVE